MPGRYKHSTPTFIGTILNSAVIPPFNNVETDVIDNSNQAFTYLDILSVVSSSGTPSGSPFLLVKLSYSADGISYETYDEAIVIDELPIASGTIRRFVKNVFVLPYRLRFNIENVSPASCNVTLHAYGRYMMFENIP